MKIQPFVFVSFLLTGLSVFSQTSSVDFEYEYKTLLNNQKSKLISAPREHYYIDGIAWHRSYGEYNYVLMPLVQDMAEYRQRIGRSGFNFVTVQLKGSSKALLASMYVFVPDYVQDSVLVSLPDVDVDQLEQQGVGFRYNDHYGKQPYPNEETQSFNALIWSAGFEISAFSTTFTGTSGIFAVDCNWDLVTCKFHGGSKSAWCSSNGSGCYPCGTSAVSNIDSDFQKTTPISMSGYKNSLFKFWKWQDLDMSEMDDRLEHWINTGSGWVLSATFKSNAPFNGAGWWSESTLLSGTIPSFNFRFLYNSNSAINGGGVYIDDLELSGAVNGVDNLAIEKNIVVKPNPSHGLFTVEKLEVDQDLQLSVLNVLGVEIFKTSAFSKETVIDLGVQNAGLYFLQVSSAEGVSIKKILIE